MCGMGWLGVTVVDCEVQHSRCATAMRTVMASEKTLTTPPLARNRPTIGGGSTHHPLLAISPCEVPRQRGAEARGYQ